MNTPIQLDVRFCTGDSTNNDSNTTPTTTGVQQLK